jgi:hypothetical protein
MNDERDPLLESLFAQAVYEPANGNFHAKVMASVKKRRRIVLFGRIAIVALLIALELLLSSPMQNSVGMMTEALSTSLVEVTNEWFAAAVAPVNSIAGLVGMLLLGVHTLYRRMVR